MPFCSVLLLSLLAATADAFAATTHSLTPKSTRALHYYRENSRFDVVGESKPKAVEMAEVNGPMVVQGGSDVDWSMNGPEECDVYDSSCWYIEPYHDVMGEQGSLINAEPHGVHKVQGGSTVDWHEGSFAAAPAAPFQAAEPIVRAEMSVGTGSYLDQL